MIAFERKILNNGLRVIIHQDTSTPMVAVNVLYDVGSRDEDPDKTGFAHLFEHLMFGGSKNIPDFDTPIQLAGGENNAFTNADMTNFYNIIPAANIETCLWLESDRMLQLEFSKKSLKTQKKVVIEEFNETCLNQPYGDLWHRISNLSYKSHPYRWPTIGLIPEHIKNANMKDVKSFFRKFYRPDNAILVIAGNLDYELGFQLAEKWFGDIPKGESWKRNIIQESSQNEYRYEEVIADVPMVSINMAYHMPDRLHPDYYAYDLLSDILSNGASSRLYRRLVKEEAIFSEIDAYLTGSTDPGLFIIAGKPMPGIELQEARVRIKKELQELCDKKITESELIKIKNKAESNLVFSEINILHKAMSLAYFELLGDTDEINRESDLYQKVTVEDIQRVARKIFAEVNCNEVIYIPSED